MRNLISSRKDAHLDLCLQRQVDSGGVATGLGGYYLEYMALPEIDLDEVDLTTEALGRPLKAPLIIGAMTGGTERARRINRRLARAASRTGIALALGSQRAMIARSELTGSYCVRDAAPDLPLLLGNLGAIQLNMGVSPDQVSGALEAVGADAVFLHLNPLQEAIQPEGDTRFAGLWQRLGEAIPRIRYPSLVKEVGAGISARTASLLARLPIAGVETAGVGGTSWARVESYRAPEGSVASEVGQRLAGFGVPTADSIMHCRRAMGQRLVVASGGIRTGMDLAVALALGADVAALARPLLEAAVESEDALVRAIETLIFELRVICFCTGARDLRQLRHTRVFRAGHPVPVTAPSPSPEETLE